jgi:hypothetical protein
MNRREYLPNSAGAGEIMESVQIAMLAGLPFTALQEAVLAHPTIIEGLISLFPAAPY